ncbi:hypothetical protein O181_011994 [Austropuccinia psidii MF-1]|uniref:Tet-like 2OG-Fe(II) oxygenase domain-containing protein n=1 Tax=Austropuccinia psidii MF-1 TaxID=1389203 RepID=A0A9Q3BVJ1_9BASI|nr:hypothetical protein [Austropuccinia psidii MF-1]
MFSYFSHNFQTNSNQQIAQHIDKDNIKPFSITEAITDPTDPSELQLPVMEDDKEVHQKPKLSRSRRKLLQLRREALKALDVPPGSHANFGAIPLRKNPDNKGIPLFVLPPFHPKNKPYIVINQTYKPCLPVSIFQIHSSNDPLYKELGKMIISLNQLAINQQPITSNNYMLGGLMKSIGFRSGSDEGESTVVYGRKRNLAAAQIEDDNKGYMHLTQFDSFIDSRVKSLSLQVTKDNENQTNQENLPNCSPGEGLNHERVRPISFSNVIITTEGFHSKIHKDDKDLNTWTYGLFAFIDKKTFQPVNSQFDPSNHGLSFPDFKFLIDFSRVHGIMEVLWKASSICHQITEPPSALKNHPDITHFECTFQMNKSFLERGNKIQKLNPPEIGDDV